MCRAMCSGLCRMVKQVIPDCRGMGRQRNATCGPALLHQQFYLFGDKDQPVGLAMWAKCSQAALEKLHKDMVVPENRLTCRLPKLASSMRSN